MNNGLDLWLDSSLAGMARQLMVSTLMVFLTVSIHAVGLTLLNRRLRSEALDEHARHISPLSVRSLTFVFGVVVALFGLHAIEIWLYAALYDTTGAVHNLETAVYFSTISYSAIGYDDRYIVEGWRLVAAIEGINGLLLLGWSTAFFVSVVTRIQR